MDALDKLKEGDSVSLELLQIRSIFCNKELQQPKFMRVLKNQKTKK